MDIFDQKQWFDLTESLTARIETDRFGPFRFQLGLDPQSLELIFHRVEDAHARFMAAPLSQVANQLEREVVVSSVFGTNTIEGGTLTEDETADVLIMNPQQATAIEQRRAINIKAAYDVAQQAAQTANWQLDEHFIVHLHQLITQDLPHADNRPGQFRDNPKGRITYVGDAAHGGRYQPPQLGRDIRKLLTALIQWHAQLQQAKIPALIRAPLVHLYFEQIHPFWDGNGRVGRVIEATLLQAAGYRYAPFALARYYLQYIDEYFTLFNTTRKAAEKKHPLPNQAFVQFHLEGMRQTLGHLQDRVNSMVSAMLFESQIRRAYEIKAINSRQYTILTHLLTKKDGMSLAELRQLPWYQSLYLKLNDKTRQRDLQLLKEKQWVVMDEKNFLLIGFGCFI